MTGFERLENIQTVAIDTGDVDVGRQSARADSGADANGVVSRRAPGVAGDARRDRAGASRPPRCEPRADGADRAAGDVGGAGGGVLHPVSDRVLHHHLRVRRARSLQPR